MAEKIVHKAVTDYLKLQYPSVKFRSDSGAGMRLTMGQAKAQKAIQNNDSWPDLFLAEPRGKYHGLFIELKDDGVKCTTKSGKPKKGHITDQANCLLSLREKGYSAFFASGFDTAKELIDEYMSLNKPISWI